MFSTNFLNSKFSQMKIKKKKKIWNKKHENFKKISRKEIL